MLNDIAQLDIRAMREELGLSQVELAQLLAVSERTIQSCEQGWRRPSNSLQRSALLLLLAHRNKESFPARACWATTECPAELRQSCIAYRSRQGHLCWLLTGTRCRGERLRSWKEKLAHCQRCGLFRGLLGGAEDQRMSPQLVPR